MKRHVKTNQKPSIIEEELKKQVDKCSQPVDIKQTLPKLAQ